MSDTHDRLRLIDQAVERLNEENVELVLHAGDFVAPFVVSAFKQLKSPLIGVFGNNDGDRKLLKKKFAELGADIRGEFAFVVVDGLRIGLLHGDQTELMRSFLELESYDVLVCGHTHVEKTYRKRRMLVINPGAVCGYLSEKATMVLFDTETLITRKIELIL